MSAAMKKQQLVNDDGTPKRKYELEEQPDSKTGVRIAIALALANTFVLLKNVVWGDAAAQNPPRAPAANDGVKLVPAESAVAALDEARDVTPEEEEDLVPPVLGSGTSLGLSAIREVFYSEDKLSFKRHGSGRSASNDNEALYGAAPGTAIDISQTGESGASTGAGSSAAGGANAPSANGKAGHSDDGIDDEDNDEDPDDDDDVLPRSNRLPVVTGPVILADLLSNQSIVLLLSDFLRNASDPDGDVLTISQLTAPSGTLVRRDDSSWLFTPATDDTSSVTFRYAVSDGQGQVAQIATIDLVPPGHGPIVGTEASETLIGTPRDDAIFALGGDDTVVAREKNDVVDAGDGNDRVVAGDGDDVVFAGAGDDVVYAGKGDDVVFGGPGADTIFGEEGSDTLIGEEGNDKLSGGDGNDTLAGGADGDTLHGDAGDDVIDGGEGEDEIDGGIGRDFVQAGADNDSVLGGYGDDTVIAAVDDGDDIYAGGEGSDTYDASGTTGAATFDLAGKMATSVEIGDDVIVGFENAIGGSGNDVFVGDSEVNIFTGGDGNDTLAGGEDADTLHGDAGDDFIDGGEGADEIDAGSGSDIVQAGGGDDTVAGGDGDDRVVAGVGDGNDAYVGGEDSDTYDASGTASPATFNLIAATATSAEIGDDVIVGFENAIGGSGDDVFVGNNELNIFTGGDGNDLFVFGTASAAGVGEGARDQILDFEIGDRIDLDDISEEFAEVIDDTFEGQQIRKFLLISQEIEFSRPGQMKFKYDALDDRPVTIIQGNVDFDRDVDFELEVFGTYEFRDDDFHWRA
jgi:Ca2+-binding RTX toxin-like protein